VWIDVQPVKTTTHAFYTKPSPVIYLVAKSYSKCMCKSTSLIQLCMSVEEAAQNQQTNNKHVWKRKSGLEDASKPEKCEA
jgi:hypothetical protein